MKWRLDDGQIEVVDQAVAEALRRKTPGERMTMIGESWKFARLWIRAAVSSQHADWEEEKIVAEVCRRLNGGSA